MKYSDPTNIVEVIDSEIIEISKKLDKCDFDGNYAELIKALAMLVHERALLVSTNESVLELRPAGITQNTFR